jgi:hypothetical protein
MRFHQRLQCLMELLRNAGEGETRKRGSLRVRSCLRLRGDSRGPGICIRRVRVAHHKLSLRVLSDGLCDKARGELARAARLRVPLQSAGLKLRYVLCCNPLFHETEHKK